MKRNLCQGSVTGNLFAMSVPTMLGMLGQTLYDLVDMVWVGRISGSAVAGVALFGTMFWLVEVLNEIIGVSSVSLITQSYGSGNKRQTEVIIEQTISFKFIVAVVAGILLLLFLEPLIRFFSDDPEVIQSALDYGIIRAVFLPIFFMSYSCFTALRCTGDPKSQMWIMLGVSILNLILDPILMFETIPYVGLPGFGLGVFGAGLATVISTCVSAVVSFGLLASGRTNVKLTFRGLFRLVPAIDKKLLTIGFPNGCEMLARQTASFVTTKFISFYGTAAIAALGIGNRLSGLVFMPLWGLMSGGGTIIGQNLGGGNLERAEKTAKAAGLFGFLSVALLMGTAMIFPRQVMGFFVDSPETIETGILMIRILGAAFIIVSFAISLGSAFTGSGYNMPFLVSSLAARWGAQVPFILLAVYLLPRLGLNLGIAGIWISFLFSDTVEALVLVYYYRKGTWKTRRVI